MVSARLYTMSADFSVRLRVLAALWICFACVALALPAHADRSDEVTAARAVVSQQIAAFQRGDGAGAYAHASPTIKALFPSVTIFMEMVRAGYPAVYQPQRFSLDPAEWQDDGRLVQPVRIEWSGGQPVIAIYVLAQQPDGSWKVDGVFMARDDRIAA
jgi:hypothetical protein